MIKQLVTKENNFLEECTVKLQEFISKANNQDEIGKFLLESKLIQEKSENLLCNSLFAEWVPIYQQKADKVMAYFHVLDDKFCATVISHFG